MQPPTEQDQIHGCHCSSLPLASQNTQYYLQSGYGLACAVASAEMSLFAEALSLWFNPFGALSLWFNPFATLSLRFDPFGRLSLRFDHLEAFLFGGIVCVV
jgi:hypothetical protein